MARIRLTGLVLAAFILAPIACLAAEPVPAPAESPKGYMIQTKYTEVTLNLDTRIATEKDVKMSTTAIGRFDLSKDTVGRVNVNVEDARCLTVPEPFKNFRVSCYSIRQDEKNVKIVVLAENYEGQAWHPLAAGSAVAALGTDPINVRAIPVTQGYSQTPHQVTYYELGVTLTKKNLEPQNGGQVVRFNIPAGH